MGRGVADQSGKIGEAVTPDQNQLLDTVFGLDQNIGLVVTLVVMEQQSVLSLVALAWGGMAAAFAPVTILALYWRRFNWPGALAAMLVGTVTAAVWAYTDGDGGVMDLNPATPGCLFSTIAGVLVALATPAPSASCQALFDKVVGKQRS